MKNIYLKNNVRIIVIILNDENTIFRQYNLTWREKSYSYYKRGITHNNN